MQFFILTPFVVALYRRKPELGILATVSLLLASTAAIFGISW